MTSTLPELRDVLTGSLVTPGDDAFGAARVFHSGVGDPAGVVRPATVDDVVAAVRLAGDLDLPVAIRGGGHSTWETLPGALVLDLGDFTEITADGTLVHVGGGATWGAVAAALRPLGLGISSGDTASVGVGGLTLVGGVGWMVRAWGLALDQLVGVQLVTAAGEVLEVDGETHPELFWALRGGGGNFGVVTRFDFRAHELPGVVFGAIRYDGDLRVALRTLRDVMTGAPDELTITLMDVPPMDPNAPAGASISVCWAGTDEAAARAVVAPLLALPGVLEEDLSVRAYADILMDMPAPDPDQPAPTVVDANALVARLDDATIDTLVEVHETVTPSVLFVRTMGGAASRVPLDSTAFPVRDAEAFVMSAAFAAPDADTAERERLAAGLSPVWEVGAGVYGNFSTTTDPSMAQRMYPPALMARLAEVKRAWDPANRFSRNHNVLPG